MDSRLRTFAILGSLAMVTAVAAVVLFLNRSASGPGQSGDAVQGGAGEALETGGGAEGSGSGGSPNADPHQIGNDLSGFLRDGTFFDPEISDVLANALDDSNRLSLIATSVEKDLRVQVVDADGEPVTGEAFRVRLRDPAGKSEEYKDLDQDGIIYVGSLPAGEYEVEMLPAEGYKIPTGELKIRVKEKVEYVVIEDISLLIRTEDEIDVSAEDSAVKEAESEADGTEVVQLQFGGSRRKTGIDVSKYQGEIDWARVAEAGVEFVIIRAGYRGSVTGAIVVDPCFEANIRGAKAAGLEVGVYFFTQAVTEAEGVEEASACISLVSEYGLELPIYIDSEGAGGSGRADGLDKAARTLVCEAFCRTCENAGFRGGVYASRSWLYNNLDTAKLESYEIWDAEYVSEPQYTGYYTMWQYTSKGQVDGISGNVDLDIYFY